MDHDEEDRETEREEKVNDEIINTIEPDDSENTPLITVENVQIYKQRWFALFIFSMNTFVNGMLFIALSSLNNIVSKYYNVSSVYIEWLTNMMMIGYIAFSIPVSYCISRFGVRPMILIAALLHTITSILQFAGYRRDRFWLVVFGQVFAAIGSSAIIQVPGKVSAVWFPENERATSTAIGTVMNLVGFAFGFVQPTLMVKSRPDKNKMEAIEEELKWYYLVRMLICILVLMLTFAYRERPPTPSSAGSPRDVISFKESVRLLWRNCRFHFLSQSFGIYIGLNCAIGVLVNPFVTWRFPHGYEAAVGWMGVGSILAAILSFNVLGKILDRWHTYYVTSILLNVLSLIVWFIFFMVLTKAHSFSTLVALYILLGLVFFPFLAVGIEQAAEMSYPVPEEISSVVILWLSNVYGFIFILCLGIALQYGLIHFVGYIIIGLYILSSIFAYFAKTDLRRLEAEGYSVH